MISVFSSFQRAAVTFAKRPALSYDGTHIDYLELLAEVVRYSESLDPAETGPVGVSGPTSLSLIVQILALSRNFQPFVYLDDSWSLAKLQETISSLGISRVLGASERVPWNQLLRKSDSERRWGQTSHIFCFTNTGGTSGAPKLVTRSHQATLDNIQSYGQTFSLGPAHRLALTSPPAYGPFVSQTLGALLHGACLCPYDLRYGSGKVFKTWILEQKITHLHLVPSVFRILSESLDRHDSLPSIQRIRLGGEPVRWTDLNLFKARFSSSARLLNGYSCSEACGNVCCQDLTDCVPEDRQPPPVGRPVSNREVVIVDDDGHALAPGLKGRIVIRSPFLADGYWNAEASTAFRTGPAGEEFWTEDLGWLTPDGVLYHCGRKNREVKFLGRWVSLGRAEETLCRFAEINDAHCVQTSDGRLIVYMAVDRNVRRDFEQELRMKLLESLGVTLPWAFLYLDRIPRLGNMKVDQIALSCLAQERIIPCRASDTELERELVVSLSELLGRPVKPQDSFYALGGSSLLAAEWAARMGYQESLAHWSMALLQATSISAFARALESVSKNTDEPDRLHCLENRSTGTAVLMILGGCGSPLKFGALKDWYQSLNYTVFGVDASLRPGDFEGLDDLAEELTSQIVRRNWETSPIILGWCTGCRLAVEVTRLLHESGIDAHCVLVNPRTLEKRSQIGNFVRRMTANFRILSRPKMILREQLRLLVTGTIRERLAHVNHVLRVLHALFRFQPWPSPGGFGTDHEAKRREYSRLSRTPLGQYHFPATCFFTSERESIPPKWEPHFSQGITLYPLPGVHETVINHLSNDSCNPLNLWFKGYLKGRRRNALK